MISTVVVGAERRGNLNARYRFRLNPGTSQPIIRFRAACGDIPRNFGSALVDLAISIAAASLIPAATRVSSIATKTERPSRERAWSRNRRREVRLVAFSLEFHRSAENLDNSDIFSTAWIFRAPAFN